MFACNLLSSIFLNIIYVIHIIKLYIIIYIFEIAIMTTNNRNFPLLCSVKEFTNFGKYVTDTFD